MNSKYILLSGLVVSALFLTACQRNSINTSQPEPMPQSIDITEEEAIMQEGTDGPMPGEEALYATATPEPTSTLDPATTPTPEPVQ